MKKVRFAYQIKIFLVILLGIVLVLAPFLFSPFSPRMYTSHEAILLNKVIMVGSRVENVSVELFKELNVTFTDGNDEYYGQVVYCVGQFEISNSSQDPFVLLESCDESMGFGENGSIVEVYHSSNENFHPFMNLLYLKSDITDHYISEVILASVLAFLYLVFTIFCEVCTFCYSENRWRKYFTLVKSRQIPLHHIYSGDEEQEPFMSKNPNYDRFGRMSMTTGCLIFPKLERNETVQTKYQLENSTNQIAYNFRSNTGYWKILAASSRHSKETMIQLIKVPITNLLLSCRGYQNLLLLPSSIFFVDLMLLGVLYGLIWFKGPVVALPAISIITKIICLFTITSLFEFFGRIMTIYSEEVLLTNSRIVFCWRERFNHKIEYLFYDDIESMELDDNMKLIKVKVTDAFQERWRQATGLKDLKDQVMPFFKYLEILEKGSLVWILEKVREAKRAYGKNREDYEGDLEEEIGMDGIGGMREEMDQENGMELPTVHEIEESTIQLDFITDENEVSKVAKHDPLLQIDQKKYSVNLK